MASIIRIKRSGSSNAPGSLSSGELAYSTLSDKLFYGYGDNGSGQATSVVTIGGQLYTDLIDPTTAGTLETAAESIPVLNSSGEIDNWNVTTTLSAGNLQLNGNTLSSTNTNGNILLTPNGAGAVQLTNVEVWQTSQYVSLTEYIQDVAGGGLVDSPEIDATYDDTAGTTSLALKTTGVGAGSYGSSTAIPTFTVDTKGRLTAAGTVSVATTLNIATDGNVTGNGVDLLNDTLTILGGEGIDTTISGDTVTISAELASSSNLGVATFNSTDFTVTGGDVEVNAITLGSSSLNPGEITTDIAGLTSVTVDNITVDGNTVSTSTGALILNPTGDLQVTHADFVANRIIYSSDASGTLTSSGDFTYDGTNLTVTGGIDVTGDVDVDNIKIDTNTISTTDTNGNLVLAPNGTATVTVPSGYEQRAGFTDESLVNKTYVDSVANGLDVKKSVRVATTGDLSATYNNGNGTLTANANGAIVIDGVTLVQNDRVLVKDQNNAPENGFYLVTTVGTSSAAFVLTRTPDANDADELTGGAFTFVEEGATNADNGYVASHNGTPTLGTDDITFDQFSGAGQISAGNGLVKSGNTIDAVGTANRITVNPDSIDIASTYVGQTSITTLGTIATGTWEGNSIANAYIDEDLTINGGTIDATPIGSTTTSSGAFTTLTASGLTTLTNTTQSTTTTTGALVVSGGVGVAKNISVGGNLTGSGASTSTLSGFDIDGGSF